MGSALWATRTTDTGLDSFWLPSGSCLSSVATSSYGVSDIMKTGDTFIAKGK